MDDKVCFTVYGNERIDEKEIAIYEIKMKHICGKQIQENEGVIIMLDTSKFYKMVLLDCGRGYFSIASVEKILDTMAACDYTHLMLGFGNDGLRLILDDMSLKVGDTCYSNEIVKNSIVAGNDELGTVHHAKGQWTQEEMDEIFQYAEQRGIGIVPFLNTPGHAWSICKAMEACGIRDACYASEGTDHHNISVKLENDSAMYFIKALVNKYIRYFSGRGCTFFNIGCDEIGGNHNGQSEETKEKAVEYINAICADMPDSIIPMAFGDVLKKCIGYPKNLIGIDWHWSSIPELYNMNAHCNWYYVLGTSEKEDGWSSYYRAWKQIPRIPVTQTMDGEKAYGSILCIWNDEFLATEKYMNNIQNLIILQAKSNPLYFTTFSK